ncbi:MAG: winged helix-turn-helix transcriptional regulator [Clostridia bacterium]|nr:winged helix-turn-helix transcriptional regulator [Clostridia bacterium]
MLKITKNQLKIVDNMNFRSYTNNVMGISKEEQIEKISNLYKILGDKTRLKILFCLLNKTCCVGEIVKEIGLSQSLVSHQLKVLREDNLVATLKIKNKVQYTLADEHIEMLISTAKTHILERINEETV